MQTPEDLIILAYKQFAGKSPHDILTTDEMDLGFTLMNQTLAVYNANGLYIPFLSTVNFIFTPGIRDYVFAKTPPFDLTPDQAFVQSNLIEDLFYLNFVNKNVDYSVTTVGDSQFYRQSKVTNLLGFPAICFTERQIDRAVLRVYPAPLSDYEATVKAKLSLNYLDKFVDITQVPDKYFKLFRYELGKELVDFYRLSTWNASAQMELDNLRSAIQDTNTFNCAIITDGVLNARYRTSPYAVNGSVVI